MGEGMKLLFYDKGIYINEEHYRYYRDVPVKLLDKLDQNKRKLVEWYFGV